MRKRIRALLYFLFFLSFAVLVGGGLFWANLRFSRQQPAGVDFTIIWRSAQNFMFDGVTPYGDWTPLELQRLVYGRMARTDENPLRLTLPLYDLVLFFPLAWVRDQATARALWMLLLQVAGAAALSFSLQLSRWKTPWYLLALLHLFAFFWLPSWLSFYDGSSILLQTALLFGALRALQAGTDELAGALIALSIVNLEATAFVILLFFFWAFSASRMRVLAGFLMTIFLLLLLAFLLMPSWVLPYWGAIFSAWRLELYPSTFSLLSGWLPGVGERLAQILMALAVALAFVEWNSVRAKDPQWLYWTASLTAALTPFFGIETNPALLAFSLPGFILVLSVMQTRWGILGQVAAFLLALLFFGGLWAAYLAGVWAVFVFVYPAFLILLLYWVRWWATRPPRLWADMLHKSGL